MTPLETATYRTWQRAVRAKIARIAGLVLLAGLLGFGLEALEEFRNDQLRQRRVLEQAQLIEAMERLGNPAVSELLTDWLLTYPEPSEDRLAELRDIARQVRRNAVPLSGVAVQLTTAAWQEPERSRVPVVWVSRPASLRFPGRP